MAAKSLVSRMCLFRLNGVSTATILSPKCGLSSTSVRRVSAAESVLHEKYKKPMLPGQTTSLTAVADSPVAVPDDPKVKISKAMRNYIERAQAHNQFMKQQTHDFAIGKRHLANMMGGDPDNFSQQEINEAIAYLFPSNLYSPYSRPLMKPPEEVFPQQKEAQFGLDGRPFHPLFYTGRPNFHQALYDAVDWMEKLNAIEDDRVRRGKPPPEKQLSLIGTEWVTKEELAAKWLEKIDDHAHRRFLTALERLGSHPYIQHAEKFVMEYRKDLVAAAIDIQPPELKTNEFGRKYAESHSTKKSCHAWVTLTEGNGAININGHDILFFPRLQDRQQIMFPFQYTNSMFRYDLTVDVRFGGYASQAIAIREGVSQCLTAFVDPDEMEKMRQAGLLTHDKRVKERKKYGFTGARGKPIWRKR